MTTDTPESGRDGDLSLNPWGDGIPLVHTGATDARVLEDITLFGVVIPAGYQTDGASVPRAFYNIIARFTDALPAALVHDIRYDPAVGEDGYKRRTMTRKQADREFYRNLRASGVSRRRAWAAYLAVRSGGRAPWNRGTKRGTVNV